MDEIRPDNADERQFWRRFSRCVRGASGACPTELELAEYADGRGPDAQREGIEAHLAACPACLEQVAEARHLAATPEVTSLVLSRAQALVPARPAFGARRTWRRVAGWAAAAAAIIALGFGGLRAGAAIRGRDRSGSWLASELTFQAPAAQRELLSSNDVLGALAEHGEEGQHD